MAHGDRFEGRGNQAFSFRICKSPPLANGVVREFAPSTDTLVDAKTVPA